MDLRQLEIIRAIAETGSFTAAGHKLHVSQSAISRQILLLEDELKEPVFLRVGRRIRITPAGESLLQLSHRVFQDLKDTIAGITDSQESLRGTVRLLGGMTVCLYVFPPLLTELKRQHPEIDLKLMTGSSERCLAAAARRRRRPGAADAAGRSAGPGDRAGPAGRAAARDGGQASAVAQAQDAAAGPGRPAVRAVRIRLEHAPRRRRVLHDGADRAANRDGNRERRDHQGDGPQRHRHHASSRIRRWRATSPSGQLFCARIEGRSLVRETGWVYPKMSRTPRAVQEVIQAFERVRPKLKLAP